MKAELLYNLSTAGDARFPAPAGLAPRRVNGPRNADIAFKETVYATGVEMLAPCPALSTPNVQNITRSGFTLRWSTTIDRGGHAGYILRCQHLDFGTAPRSFPQTTAHIGATANITDLPPNSTWVVFVAAYDAGGNVVQESPGVTVTTLP